MKDTRKNTLSFETCMDILDWFNDDTRDYIEHIWERTFRLLVKLDGEERIRRAMPSISEYCLKLVAAHSATENAYPQAI